MQAIVLALVLKIGYDRSMNRTPTRYNGQPIGAVLAAQGRRRDWLADQVGVSASTVTRWIKGDLSITHHHAELVAKALGVPFFVIAESRKQNDKIPSMERERIPA